MKAKQIFMTEADDFTPSSRPPGGPNRPPRPMRRPMPPPGGGAEDFDPADDVSRVMGREPAGPPKQFNPKELGMLKDVLVLTLAQLIDSDLDTQIGLALAEGRDLEPQQLQHILDEARNVRSLPEAHGQLLQKIYTKLQAQPPA